MQPGRREERVGVFGGTFDPVHIGHLVAALEVRHALALDRMLLVVAADPWQKRGRVEATAAQRLAMVRAAVAGIDGIEASAIEIERGGPTYTVDTLEALRSPQRALFLVLGADAVRGVGTWHRADDLARLATLVVIDRAGDADAPVADSAGPVERVAVPRIDITSTELRARIRSGAPADVLVPAGALAVIRDEGLYR